MFECKEQEIHDPNTGVTLAFGRHKGGAESAWVRVTSVNNNITRITTIIFDSSGAVMTLTPHRALPPDDEPHIAEADRSVLMSTVHVDDLMGGQAKKDRGKK